MPDLRNFPNVTMGQWSPPSRLRRYGETDFADGELALACLDEARSRVLRAKSGAEAGI